MSSSFSNLPRARAPKQPCRCTRNKIAPRQIAEGYRIYCLRQCLLTIAEFPVRPQARAFESKSRLRGDALELIGARLSADPRLAPNRSIKISEPAVTPRESDTGADNAERRDSSVKETYQLMQGSPARLRWSRTVTGADIMGLNETEFSSAGTSGNCVLAEPFLSHRFSDQRADAG